MQTQCPICDELIPCDKDDIGKSRRCPVCEIDFVAVMIPTVDDEKQKAERRSLLVNYIIPVISTVLLFGTAVSAFWLSYTIRREDEAQALKSQEAEREKTRIANEERERQLAQAAEQQRIARESAARIAATVPKESTNTPSPEIAAPVDATAAMDNAKVTPVVPDTKTPGTGDSEDKVLSPDGMVDLREVLGTAERIDPILTWSEPANVFVSHDGQHSLVVNAEGHVRYSHIWEGFRTDFPFPDHASPGQLIPLSHRPVIFAAVGSDGLVKFLNEKGIELNRTRLSDSRIVDCTLMTTGTLLFATEDGRAGIYNHAQRRLTEFRFPHALRRICLATNCRGYLMAGTDRRIHWFNGTVPPEFSVTATIPIEHLAATEVRLNRLVIVVGDQKLEVISEKTAAPLFQRDLAGLTVTDIAVCKNECMVVATKEGYLLTISLVTGELVDVSKCDGEPLQIRADYDLNGVRIWSNASVESERMFVKQAIRMASDPELVAAATDAARPYPVSGDPEIRLLDVRARSAPLSMESVSTDKESKTLSIRGKGFTGVEEISVLRPGESTVRLKATVVSDDELTVPWSPRITGGIPVIQSGQHLAVPVPLEMRRVVPPPVEQTTNASPQGGDSAKKSDDEAEQTAEEAVEPEPDLSGFRFLLANQTIAVVPDTCQFLFVTEGASITEAIHGKSVVVYQTAAELPESVSDDARLILQSSPSSERRPRGKTNSLSAEVIIPCPVRDGIPIP
ncbi:MAG: hypothetical protein JNM43_10980 [Planctomycetaceae bacterium]|nr:hypothetical protein [Planctomycetaceae bacterium]